MKMWLLIILLLIVCSLAASLTQQVFGQYGSDLHFPLSQLCREPFLDIYAGESHIGNYVEHILQGFKAFKDRLQFDHESCTFRIKNFLEADGHNFRFTNFGPTVQMDFKVVVPAVRDIADEYISNEYTSDECTSGLVALGFSMDPIICLFFIILAEKMKEKRWNNDEIVSCIKQAVLSFLGKDKRNWINFACIFIKVFSLLCKAISLISLVCCGNEGNLNALKRNQSFCYVVEAVQSLAFPAFIYFLYISQYRVNSTHLVWVLVASPLISVILKIVIFIPCRTLFLRFEEKKY